MQPPNLSPVLHAQHPFVLPGSVGARLTAQGVKIRLPRRGQFSRAVDSLEPSCTAVIGTPLGWGLPGGLSGQQASLPSCRAARPGAVLIASCWTRPCPRCSTNVPPARLGAHSLRSDLEVAR